jgi:hypothetical protein
VQGSKRPLAWQVGALAPFLLLLLLIMTHARFVPRHVDACRICQFSGLVYVKKARGPVIVRNSRNQG